MPQDKPEHFRRIRSFVRRPGRLTPAQRQALDELLPVYGVDESVADVRATFKRSAPLVVEIGFGNGEALAWMAAREPEKNFLGLEVHEPGVGRLLRALRDDGLDNVRVAMRDAVEVLSEQVPPGALDEVRIYFPDPWPKKRHHKRRLIQPDFMALLGGRVASGGRVHLATDWAEYAQWMIQVASAAEAFSIEGDGFVPRPAWRPPTHFEKRGLARGHRIHDLVLMRRPDA